ncbi:MAG: SH3 domain-containing protein [Anaerovibrio sp.]|uniref:SH3 domain-containing protein n=1 Tax=Anaerovibrio sp. TaxID=1872532 RepID=UPI0025F683E1|nr:SH3 domain-containing protein [Anaerovibrio sp.]MCR5175557.1 SH3 domain-containing protein [Anaerovibrio sp.]
MSRFCPKCGSEIQDGVKFCRRCGTALNVRQIKPATSINYQSGNFQQPPGGYMPNQYSSKSHGNGFYVLIATLIFALCVGSFMIFSHVDLDKSDSAAKDEYSARVEKHSPDALTQPQQPHNTGVITGTEVRMRGEPNLQGNIIGYFDRGEVVEIIDSTPEWAKVKRANGAVGWVSVKFCSF